jgi:hypothetical protein
VATVAKPDGWNVLKGTLGTDIVREVTTTLSGGSAIKFASSANDAELESEPFLIESAVTYNVAAVFRADRKNAGDNVIVYFDQYDGTGTQVASNVMQDGPVNTINTWETKSGNLISIAGGRYVKIRIGRVDNNDFNVIFDRVLVERETNMGYLNNPTGNVTVALARIDWTAASFLNMSNDGLYQSSDFSVDQIEVYRAGLYHIKAFLEVDGFGAGVQLRARFIVNAVTDPSISFFRATKDPIEIDRRQLELSQIVRCNNETSYIALEAQADTAGTYPIINGFLQVTRLPGT